MARALPLVLAAAVLLRLFLLERDLDAVAIPAYELSTVGNMARIESAVEGGLPLHRYYDNCGARLLVGLAGAALYATVDDSYRTLKLVPLACFVLALVLLWVLVDRHVGRRAANVAALLFAFLPPTLVRFSLIAMGSHFESLPILLLVWLLFLETHARGVPARWLAATGVAAGFSVFVSFGVVVLLVVLAGQHVLRRGLRRTAGDLRVALPAFVLGLAPLLWITAATGARPVRFLAENLPDGAASARWVDKGRELFVDVLPRAPTFPDVGPIPGRVLDVAFLLVLAAAWIATATALRRGDGDGDGERGTRRLLLGAALLHFPVFLAFALATDFDFHAYGSHTEVGRFRYLVPPFAVGTILVAATIARGARPVRRGLGVACVALASAAPFVAVGPPIAGAPPPYAGHAMQYHARTVLADVPRDPETGRLDLAAAAAAGTWRRFGDAMRGAVRFGLGHLLALDAADAGAAVDAR
ncbi:MAG: hypothetical protein ACF8XB_03670, partial [Planctomycetota bacterium JB042]